MTEQTPIPPAASAPPQTDTEYVILSLQGDGVWTKDRIVKARSADAAIRTFVNGTVTTETTLVAVPARSWKPVRVKPKTVTTLVIEEA